MNAIYIHIPFCNSSCTYCDFPKVCNHKWIDSYLDALNNEIKSKYKGEVIKTIYIGGGTPSVLSNDEITKLFNIISIFKVDSPEITFECNPESLTKDKLELLYKYGVNRISIGAETFNPYFLKLIGRNHTGKQVIDAVEMAKKVGFSNINIDLMYAFPGETLEDLNRDLDEVIKLDVPHISSYSLIIEPNTVISDKGIHNIDSDMDADMYEMIIGKLSNYHHYETSNFSIPGYESKHNLVYWNNDNYYGFGMGASGYIDNIRYDNTRNIIKYMNGNYEFESHKLDINETIENEFILGLRKVDGINKNKFKAKYNLDINKIDVVKKLIDEDKLIDKNGYIFINHKYIYTSNAILVDFIGEKYE